MIKLTDEMLHDAINAFEKHADEPALHSIAALRAALEAALAVVDQDYVTRWGLVRIQVPGEMSIDSRIMEYLKGEATQRAKLMGGEVIDIDDFTVEPSSTAPYSDLNIYMWKVRRD
jgi:hypothetical protein